MLKHVLHLHIQVSASAVFIPLHSLVFSSFHLFHVSRDSVSYSQIFKFWRNRFAQTWPARKNGQTTSNLAIGRVATWIRNRALILPALIFSNAKCLDKELVIFFTRKQQGFSLNQHHYSAATNLVHKSLSKQYLVKLDKDDKQLLVIINAARTSSRYYGLPMCIILFGR